MLRAPLSTRPPHAILFDLDGTLADTAPDLAAALNRLQTERGMVETPYEELRPFASSGARGLIGAGFKLSPCDAEYEALRISFLDHYAADIAVSSTLFAGVTELLERLTAHGLKWGIVTNKAARFTDVLVPLIGLGNAQCIVSGDTTPHAKPHPAPLFEGAARLGVKPNECCYVGDDLRDIQAGQAAGMTTFAAEWGYCGTAGARSWNADHLLAEPLDLLNYVSQATS